MSYIKYKGRVYRSIDAVMTSKEVRSQKAKEKNDFKELQKNLMSEYADAKKAEIQKIDGMLKTIESQIKKLKPADLKQSSNPTLIEDYYKNVKNWMSSARRKIKQGRFDAALKDVEDVNQLLSKTSIRLNSVIKEIKSV